MTSALLPTIAVETTVLLLGAKGSVEAAVAALGRDCAVTSAPVAQAINYLSLLARVLGASPSIVGWSYAITATAVLCSSVGMARDHLRVMQALGGLHGLTMPPFVARARMNLPGMRMISVKGCAESAIGSRREVAQIVHSFSCPDVWVKDAPLQGELFAPKPQLQLPPSLSPPTFCP